MYGLNLNMRYFEQFADLLTRTGVDVIIWIIYMAR